jgi:hypothetical protein
MVEIPRRSGVTDAEKRMILGGDVVRLLKPGA